MATKGISSISQVYECTLQGTLVYLVLTGEDYECQCIHIHSSKDVPIGLQAINILPDIQH